MLKILADECVHRDLVEALKNEEFDILSVKDIEKGADDVRVFELAKESRRALLTFDRGFGDFLDSILRLINERADNKEYPDCPKKRDLRGKLVIIGKKVRVRSFR